MTTGTKKPIIICSYDPFDQTVLGYTMFTQHSHAKKTFYEKQQTDQNFVT